MGRCRRRPVSFRPDTMTVITSDGLKVRPEGPKGRRPRKKNKGKTEKKRKGDAEEDVGGSKKKLKT